MLTDRHDGGVPHRAMSVAQASHRTGRLGALHSRPSQSSGLCSLIAPSLCPHVDSGGLVDGRAERTADPSFGRHRLVRGDKAASSPTTVQKVSSQDSPALAAVDGFRWLTRRLGSSVLGLTG